MCKSTTDRSQVFFKKASETEKLQMFTQRKLIKLSAVTEQPIQPNK